MSRISKSNFTGLIVFNLAIFIGLYLLNSYMPFYFEEILDYAFYQDIRLISISDIISNTNRIYLYRTGRYLPSLFVSLIMLDETKFLFNIINSLFFILIINTLIQLFDLKYHRNYFLFLILGLFIFITPNFVGTTIWVLASVEYFWPTGLMILILYGLRFSQHYRLKSIIFMTAFILLVSSMSEIVGIGLTIYLIIRHTLNHGFKIKNITKFDFFYNRSALFVVFSIIGTAVVVFSPAALARSQSVEYNSLILGIFFSGFRVLYYFIYYFYIPLIFIFILLTIAILVDKNSVLNLKENGWSHFLAVSVLSLLPLTISSGFSIRLLIVPGIFLLLTILSLVQMLFRNEIHFRKPIIALNTLVILALFVFFINQIHMIVEFEPRENNQNIYWFIEKMENFEWPQE